MKNEKAKKVIGIILKGLLISGAIAIAATSPYFVPVVLPKIIKHASYTWKKKKERKKFYRSFYYLKSKGFVKIENVRGQIYVSLTKEGKKLAGKYQIDDLRIKKPFRWDKKWRILIFDIKEKHKITREALRGKLKELGLFQLQKSVWVCPYNFQNEVDILRKFFNLNVGSMQVITAYGIENDTAAKAFFNLEK